MFQMVLLALTFDVLKDYLMHNENAFKFLQIAKAAENSHQQPLEKIFRYSRRSSSASQLLMSHYLKQVNSFTHYPTTLEIIYSYFIRYYNISFLLLNCKFSCHLTFSVATSS